jgi:hypothetical protein
MAAKLRRKWQTQIDEGKYIPPKPRTDLVLFAEICDKAEEYYKKYTRGWDAIAAA